MKYVIFIAALSVLLFSSCSRLGSAKNTLVEQSPVLMIDAGHGGADGGAVADDGSKESELNLSVALKVEALCAFLGQDCVMTRRSEDICYPDTADTIRKMKLADQKARIALINSYPRGVLISIHQNIYPSAAPKGAQALYGRVEGSERMADILQSNAALLLGEDKNRGTAGISEDIYLMKKVECPAVLFECGFMSNPDELILLKDEEYQKQLAAVITAAGIQFLSETGNSYG